MVAPEDLTQRILILAPVGRDASAAAQHLVESKLTCAICANVEDLHAKLQEGAAAALITEEAFLHDGTQSIEKWVANQPAWSDFPFVVLTTRATSPAAQTYRV